MTQDDVFLGNLTVREQLLFSAMLRLPAALSHDGKLARVCRAPPPPLPHTRSPSLRRAGSDGRAEQVDRVAKQLGLTACLNTRIGTALVRGVSGGERKRTNIGVELLSDPRSLPFLSLSLSLSLTLSLSLSAALLLTSWPLLSPVMQGFCFWTSRRAGWTRSRRWR